MHTEAVPCQFSYGPRRRFLLGEPSGFFKEQKRKSLRYTNCSAVPALFGRPTPQIPGNEKWTRCEISNLKLLEKKNIHLQFVPPPLHQINEQNSVV